MKHLTHTLLAVAVLLLCATTTATAKQVQTPKMYIFGLAASFNDTIVHMTDVQELDSVWTDDKTKFLLNREQYSRQLRDYLGTQQMKNRTCIVFFSPKRSKLEKKFIKTRRLYTKGKDGKSHYDVRYVQNTDFRFHAVEPVVEVVENEEAEGGEAPVKKAPKKKKTRKGSRK